MDSNSLTQSPFAALTFVAAAALLTNASSMLGSSTNNRMLRPRDRMSQLFVKSEAGGQFGFVKLFPATQLSLINIREEPALVRARQMPKPGTAKAESDARLAETIFVTR